MQPLSVVCLALLAVLGGAKHVNLPAPFSDYCILKNNTNKYDPQNQFQIPWFNVDLDLPPNQRWTEVATAYKPQIQDLINTLIELILEPIFPNMNIDFVDKMLEGLQERLPEPYRSEIQSIADIVELPVGQVTVYNIFYEIFTVCTSIIAQDPSGKLTHARNLDFGLFLGWNYTIHEWPISQKLRNMIVNVNWIKDGKVLYKSNNFAGYIGIYNGLKQGSHSITANERFQAAGGYLGMYRWLTGLEPNGKWMSWLTRECMENSNSFQEAKNFLMNTPILSPVYLILGGAKPWEGVIITRSLNATDLVTPLNKADPNGWYILETNYDQDKPVLYLDDRRTPGNKCMQMLGQKNVNFQGIYNVLSSRTNLNKLTTYTLLMEVASGKFETHLQSCPGECWPF